jgi:hypothetical protein
MHMLWIHSERQKEKIRFIWPFRIILLIRFKFRMDLHSSNSVYRCLIFSMPSLMKKTDSQFFCKFICPNERSFFCFKTCMRIEWFVCRSLTLLRCRATLTLSSSRFLRKVCIAKRNQRGDSMYFAHCGINLYLSAAAAAAVANQPASKRTRRWIVVVAYYIMELVYARLLRCHFQRSSAGGFKQCRICDNAFLISSLEYIVGCCIEIDNPALGNIFVQKC